MEATIRTQADGGRGAGWHATWPGQVAVVTTLQEAVLAVLAHAQVCVLLLAKRNEECARRLDLCSSKLGSW